MNFTTRLLQRKPHKSPLIFNFYALTKFKPLNYSTFITRSNNKHIPISMSDVNLYESVVFSDDSDDSPILPIINEDDMNDRSLHTPPPLPPHSPSTSSTHSNDSNVSYHSTQSHIVPLCNFDRDFANSPKNPFLPDRHKRSANNPSHITSLTSDEKFQITCDFLNEFQATYPNRLRNQMINQLLNDIIITTNQSTQLVNADLHDAQIMQHDLSSTPIKNRPNEDKVSNAKESSPAPKSKYHLPHAPETANLFGSSSLNPSHYPSSPSNQPVDVNPLTQIPKTEASSASVKRSEVVSAKKIDMLINGKKDNNETNDNKNFFLPVRNQSNLLDQKRAYSTAASVNPNPANTSMSRKPLQLSEEQQLVLDLVMAGKNIFYTGSAGTGKSLLLKSLISELRRKHPRGTVGVTASTGLASCNIGGQTLNSFAGIGLGVGTAEALLKKVRTAKTFKDKWLKLRVLIIDEISMVEGELLDKLDYIAKSIKKNNYPFGGIQLIICGDFFQLPPVNKMKDPTFAFESKAWKDAIKININLTTVFRQQSDQTFIEMLNEVRNGDVSPKVEYGFRLLNRTITNVPPGITPSELYPTRREVDQANNRMLNRLPGPPIEFKAIDSGSIKDEAHRTAMLSSFLAAPSVYLKKGAQVMMIKNIDETLVNGTLGKVIDFIDPNTYSTYRNFKDDAGQNDEETITAMEDMFNNYLGKKREGTSLISNVQDLDYELDESVFSFLFQDPNIAERNKEAVGHPQLSHENRDSLMEQESDSFLVLDSVVKEAAEMVDINFQRKRELIKKLYANCRGRRLPLVRFNLVDGTTRDVLVEPETFSIEDENEKPLAARLQIPLMLAWSISIHKSQGQTLNYVRIDLQRIFEKGQAYVALSRATARKGLQVLNFNAAKVQTNGKVIEFYKNLISANQAMLAHAKEDDGEKPEVDFASPDVQENLEPSISRYRARQNEKFKREPEDYNFVVVPKAPFFPPLNKEEIEKLEETNRMNFKKTEPTVPDYPIPLSNPYLLDPSNTKRRKLEGQSVLDAVLKFRKPNNLKTSTDSDTLAAEAVPTPVDPIASNGIIEINSSNQENFNPMVEEEEEMSLKSKKNKLSDLEPIDFDSFQENEFDQFVEGDDSFGSLDTTKKKYL